MAAHSDLIQVRNPVDRDFTMVPNAIWRIEGLSVTARAVFCFLLSWRDGASVRVSIIESSLGIGRDARRKAFKELREVGLLKVETRNLDRGRFDTVMTVDATPLIAMSLLPSTVSPPPENPSPVKPSPVRPSPVNQAKKGRKSTPPPPENQAPYKDNIKTSSEPARDRPPHEVAASLGLPVLDKATGTWARFSANPGRQ